MLARLLMIPLLVVPLFLCAAESDTQRLNECTSALNELMNAGDKSIPSSLFQKAFCVVVIPSMKKGGFVFSAKYGRGFASCRNPSGGWTAPGAMRVEGGGFGLQIGASTTDIVMLVMSEKGQKGLLASKFTLGAEASGAAGPVGRDATAQTDATMRADILSWSRSQGVFGGLSLQSGTLRPDTDVNQALYGKKEDNKDILTGKVQPPAAATGFLDALTKYGGATQTK
ncbi:MAG: lipid-binding SYLF domain-containing protein [Acidobacteriaceae bacterium]|nr:lipid-binding SYLF domain-containing protein [Acidobacteriaceae bacterium]MBV9500289.1 lipid-binding SYLF domain-containing protein [Acidobacteriaceae bacterium]